MRPATGIHILIIDDHPVVRHGLRTAVEREPDMTVVGAVASLEDALDLSRTTPGCPPEGGRIASFPAPDVILLDLMLPGVAAEQAVTQIRRAHPAAPILLLSTDEAGDDLCRALEAGAAGCVSRDAELDEMVEAIRTIHTGASWIPSEIGERCRAYKAGARLSEDELRYLRLLAAGKARQEIAATLGWSESHARDRMRRIQRKLGAKNQTHALVTALQRGIVSVD
jgi:two-component system NarL family response regulator